MPIGSIFHRTGAMPAPRQAGLGHLAPTAQKSTEADSVSVRGLPTYSQLPEPLDQ